MEQTFTKLNKAESASKRAEKLLIQSRMSKLRKEIKEKEDRLEYFQQCLDAERPYNRRKPGRPSIRRLSLFTEVEVRNLLTLDRLTRKRIIAKRGYEAGISKTSAYGWLQRYSPTWNLKARFDSPAAALKMSAHG